MVALSVYLAKLINYSAKLIMHKAWRPLRCSRVPRERLRNKEAILLIDGPILIRATSLQVRCIVPEVPTAVYNIISIVSDLSYRIWSRQK